MPTKSSKTIEPAYKIYSGGNIIKCRSYNFRYFQCAHKSTVAAAAGKVDRDLLQLQHGIVQEKDYM